MGERWRKVLVGNLESRRPLGILRFRREDRMVLKEIGWVWIGLIWLRIGTNGGVLRKR